MNGCPVIGCAGEPHSCDPLDRHAFDGQEDQGVRLAAWVKPMNFGQSHTWVWTAFTEMTIDAQHQMEDAR